MLASTKKFALLIDIDNMPVTRDVLGNILAQATSLGEVAYAKFYGYSDRKHKELEDIINSGAFDVAQRMRFKKRNKSELDNRIIIDAIKIACLNPTLDGFFIVGGAGDFVPMISALKSLGKYVVGGFNDEENNEVCHQSMGLFKPEVKIQKVKPINVPRVAVPEKPKAETVSDETAEITEIDNMLKNTGSGDMMTGNADFDINEALKQIKNLVDDFKEINK